MPARSRGNEPPPGVQKVHLAVDRRLLAPAQRLPQAASGGTEVVLATLTMKTIPSVQKYMTTTPTSLNPGDTLAHAHSLMRELKIRHLPVCEGDQVVGLLSDGDLFRAESLHDADPNKLKASDVMGKNPYTVSPQAPLDEVVQEMARKKYGSAVVVDNHKVVGVFTATDALGAFAELLHTRLA